MSDIKNSFPIPNVSFDIWLELNGYNPSKGLDGNYLGYTEADLYEVYLLGKQHQGTNKQCQKTIIKPIEWGEPAPPNGNTRFYDHMIGKTPLGEYSIEWKSWKSYDDYVIYLNEVFVTTRISLDDAKVAATKHYERMVRNCIEIQETIKETNE